MSGYTANYSKRKSMNEKSQSTMEYLFPQDNNDHESLNVESLDNDNISYQRYDNHLTDGQEPEGDEPIIELLERERSEWHEELMTLENCINLQQIELSQRESASQSAAAIVEEFTKTLRSFEDRLINVEMSVQNELKSIREIAESLRIAVAAIQQSQERPTK